jgi:hypothetical protein
MTALNVTSEPVTRGRDADDRRRVARHVVDAAEVGDRPSAADLDAGALGAVHRASAAEPDDPVAAALAVERRGFGDVRRSGIGLRVGIDRHVDACGADVPGDRVDDARAGDAAVRDEQRPSHAQLGEAFAGERGGPAPVEDARRALEGVDGIPGHHSLGETPAAKA